MGRKEFPKERSPGKRVEGAKRIPGCGFPTTGNDFGCRVGFSERSDRSKSHRSERNARRMILAHATKFAEGDACAHSTWIPQT